MVNVERRGETEEEKLPRERLISLSEKFRRAGHLSTYAPCSISSSSPIPSLPRQIKTVLLLLLLERESLFNRPDWKKRRRGKTRGKTETGIFIRKFDLTLAGQFESSGEISNKFNE